MKTNALNFGLLFLRLGISIGMLTHGYGKFMKILAGDFSFGDLFNSMYYCGVYCTFIFNCRMENTLVCPSCRPKYVSCFYYRP